MAAVDRPAKRVKLLSDTESSSDEEEPIPCLNGGLKINEEYAQRFEHNKKREEKDRLEEKYGKASSQRALDSNDVDDEDEDSSSDETEDDDAELATKDLDAEIEETLAAIKRKDPRVYDKEVRFYQEFDPDTQEVDGTKKDKPMSLHDYHRRNLLEGFTGDEQDEVQAGAPRTYGQEQEDLKRDVVGDMHANATNGEMSDGEEDDFLVAKRQPIRNELLAQLPPKEITDADVAAANKDPETYLSNFMAARAWLPTTTSQFAALESDDSEDERRADAFEEAYNLRFEEPEHANEKLKTFARDAAKYSVRRDDDKGRARKRARDREKERKDQEKRERQEERKRLRDLRVEEMAAKVNKIREAAGLRGKHVNIDEWRDVLEGDFDDSRWEEEMRNRFGESYYAAEEDEDGFGEQEEEIEGRPSKKRKPKKPTWNDDIDIKDLVPEFEDADKPAFTLSSDDEANDEEDGGVPVAPDDPEERDTPWPLEAEAEDIPTTKRRSKKDFAKEKADARRAERIERRKIEEMVDSNLPLEHPSLAASTKSQTVAGFRYRETSPTSFGLTARDILFADDSQLNQYAGLKKMAAFRDAEKKRRDKKRYSKKGRLREWRKETFGSKDEPSGGFEKLLGRRPGMPQEDMQTEVHVDGVGTKAKKRKRSKNKKKQETAA
jgi:protein KRI1